LAASSAQVIEFEPLLRIVGLLSALFLAAPNMTAQTLGSTKRKRNVQIFWRFAAESAARTW
jgi:hypothetical protein